MNCLAHPITQIVSFPLAPEIVRLSQVPGADLHKVAQQPDETNELFVLLLPSRLVDPLTHTLDPDVAVVQVAERGLYASDILCVSVK